MNLQNIRAFKLNEFITIVIMKTVKILQIEIQNLLYEPLAQNPNCRGVFQPKCVTQKSVKYVSSRKSTTYLLIQRTFNTIYDLL